MTSKRTSNLRELFNSNTLVATYNADPFAIEYEEMLDEVLNTMDEYAEVYTKDDEDFDVMASQLDGNVNTYSEIYRSNGTMVGVLAEYTNDIESIANNEGLELVETTSEASGYPRQLRKAIIGLDDMDQAERLAKAYDLDITIIEKRDGWDLWYRTGNRVYEPFELTAEDFGVDSELRTQSDLKDYYDDYVRPFIDEFDDIETLRAFLDNQEKIMDKLEELEDGEALLIENGEACNVVKTTCMRYNLDSKSYAIALVEKVAR